MTSTPSPVAGIEEQIKAIVNNALSRLRTADGKGIMHMTTAEFVLREDIAALLAVQNDATYTAVMEAIGGELRYSIELSKFNPQEALRLDGRNIEKSRLRSLVAKIFGKEQV